MKLIPNFATAARVLLSKNAISITITIIPSVVTCPSDRKVPLVIHAHGRAKLIPLGVRVDSKCLTLGVSICGIASGINATPATILIFTFPRHNKITSRVCGDRWIVLISFYVGIDLKFDPNGVAINVIALAKHPLATGILPAAFPNHNKIAIVGNCDHRIILIVCGRGIGAKLIP